MCVCACVRAMVFPMIDDARSRSRISIFRERTSNPSLLICAWCRRYVLPKPRLLACTPYNRIRNHAIVSTFLLTVLGRGALRTCDVYRAPLYTRLRAPGVCLWYSAFFVCNAHVVNRSTCLLFSFSRAHFKAVFLAEQFKGSLKFWNNTDTPPSSVCSLSAV